MEEKEININGLKVNYKVAGEGRPVLILHGWGGSSDSWIAFQKILAEKGKYKVIVLDFPGFGKSITPPEPWGLQNYADFVLSFAERLSLGQFFLIGHSFGGRISIKFVTQHPEKVKKLILCDSAGIKPKPGLKTLMIFWMARLGNAVFTPRYFIRFKDAARNLFYVFLRNKDYVKANGTMKETIKRVLAEDLLPELSQVKVKTMIVWGKIDRMVPLRYARMFKEKIVDSKLEILPKIGHSPHLESPEKLSGVVFEFLKS